MRSSRPKPLHLICGRAMVLHVVHALEKLQPDAPRWSSATAPSRSPRRCSSWPRVGQRRLRRAGRAERHGRRRSHRDDRVPRRRLRRRVDDRRAPGRHAAARADTLDELVATHVANGNAATLLTSVMDDPTGYGRVIRKADGQVLRIVEQRDAAPRNSTSKRSARASTRSGATSSARAAQADDRQRPGRVLPDRRRSRCSPRWATASDVSQAPSAETQGVNDRWQLALAERELRAAPTAVAAQRRHDARPAADLHRRHRQASAATSRCTRARSCRARPSSATAATSGPTPGWSTAPSARGLRRAHRRPRRRDRAGAVVGPYAHLPAGSSVAAGRTTGAFYTAPAD